MAEFSFSHVYPKHSSCPAFIMLGTCDFKSISPLRKSKKPEIFKRSIVNSKRSFRIVIKIPESCVPGYGCGTYAPGWKVGDHHTVAENKVTRSITTLGHGMVIMLLVKLHRGSQLWIVKIYVDQIIDADCSGPRLHNSGPVAFSSRGAPNFCLLYRL